MATSFSSAGLERAYISLEDTNGLITGLTLTTAVNTVYSFQEVKAVIDSEYQEPGQNVVNTRGNNKALFSYSFDPTEKASGGVTLGVLDLTALARMQGNDVLTSGDISYALRNGNNKVIKSGWLSLFTHAQSADTATYGNSSYYWQLLRVTLRPVGAQGLGFQAENTFRYEVLAKPFSVFAWGESLVEGTHGHTTADGFDGNANDFIMIDRWTANGSAVSFSLSATPTSTTTIKVWAREADGTVTELTEETVTPTTPGTGEWGIDGTTLYVGDTWASGDSVFVRYGVA